MIRKLISVALGKLICFCLGHVVCVHDCTLELIGRPVQPMACVTCGKRRWRPSERVKVIFLCGCKRSPLVIYVPRREQA